MRLGSRSTHSEIAFDEFGRDWDNYRAAVSYGSELGEIETVRRLLAALGDYADLTQRVEHADWAERLLERAAASDDPSIDLDSTKAGLARILQLQDLDRTRALLAELAKPTTVRPEEFTDYPIDLLKVLTEAP